MMLEYRKIEGYVTYNLDYTSYNLDYSIYNLNSCPIITGPGY